MPISIIVATSAGVEKWPDSLYRECRLRDLLERHAPGITVEHMQAALCDRFGDPNAISRRPDPSLAFDRAVRKRCPTLNANEPLFAEGGLLAHEGFRRYFLNSLARAGLDLSDVQAFFLNPDAKSVFAHRLERSARRQADLDISMETVMGEVEWYRGEVGKLGDCASFGDSKTAETAILEYLNQ